MTLKRSLVDPDQEDLYGARRVRPQRVAASREGMVASAHYEATAAGAEMLAAGGNAIDSAVATAFALGVCEPAASGLGGQTMALIHLAETGKTLALDGSSRAPNRATPGSLDSVERLQGHRATTVPSTPAVLSYLLETYGRLKLPQILAPAIQLAEDGYIVSELQHGLAKKVAKNLRQGPARELFLSKGTRPYRPGQRFYQPVLAKTLRALARRGVKDFYTGQIARAIHRDMQRNGGLLHRDDLAQIPRPIERRPVRCRFGNMRVVTFPPPGAGRTLVEALNILSQFPERRRDPETPEGAVLLAETIRRAFIDRTDRPYDPNFYPQVQNRLMLSADYAKLVAKQVRQRVEGRGETTHLSVMDSEGNVVALTQSIERVYGSCVASPDLGFLYNDYMSAFEYDDISHPYYLRPNAVPWASVAPTIVFRGKRPWLAIGSPGSERIVSAIMQVLLRLGRQSPYDAVAAPRLHCSLKGKVSIEASRMRDDIPAALADRGFEVDVRDDYSFYLGCVQLVIRDKDVFTGVADPRRDGSAGGPRS